MAVRRDRAILPRILTRMVVMGRHRDRIILNRHLPRRTNRDSTLLLPLKVREIPLCIDIYIPAKEDKKSSSLTTLNLQTNSSLLNNSSNINILHTLPLNTRNLPRPPPFRDPLAHPRRFIWSALRCQVRAARRRSTRIRRRTRASKRLREGSRRWTKFSK